MEIKESKVKVLGISCSTHAMSRSEKMLKQILGHAKKYGAQIDLIRLTEKKITTCESCCSISEWKCVYPCIHGDDDTREVLNKIVDCDSLAISGGIHWGMLSALFADLIEKMTAIENNEDEIWRQTGKDPLEGKPCVLVGSKEYEGASLALSQAMWALNRLGFVLLPYACVHKPALLERRIVRLGLVLLGYKNLDWIENTLRLHGRNLALLPKKLADFQFDDHKVTESKS